MAEYIDRKVAIKQLRDVYEYEFPTASGVFDEFATKIVPNVLKSIPAVDVAPVMYGSWERDTDGDWYCTNCDEVVTICESGKERTYRKPYCPNCGAKMNRGTNNEQSNWTENR